MVSKTVPINIKFGLHARPAGVLAKMAQKYQSDVKMKVAEKTVNVKSIMGLLSAGVQCGAQAEFTCNGEDEILALSEITAAVAGKLGETE